MKTKTEGRGEKPTTGKPEIMEKIPIVMNWDMTDIVGYIHINAKYKNKIDWDTMGFTEAYIKREDGKTELIHVTVIDRSKRIN